MTVLISRHLHAVLAFAAVCLLAACATTNTASETGETAQSEFSDQAEAGVVEPLDREVVTRPADTQALTDPTLSAITAEPLPESVTTGSLAPADIIEGVAEFPEQNGIQEPLQVEDTAVENTAAMQTPSEIQSDSDAKISRLRRELAVTESELARIRAEEAERDFAEGLADSASAIGELESGPPAHTTTAQASEVPEPGTRARAPDLPGKPADYSIYFDYNQTLLESEFESIVVMHAEYLKANPGLIVEIQGNCDERGSREFNIALGERRAHTVKRALELLGIDGGRVQTVSFGSEKPIAFGHDEESWRLNRRADIVY